ncbi:MAG TPA: DUF2726 domain-containing protein [Phycisphaerales bacterium]
MNTSLILAFAVLALIIGVLWVLTRFLEARKPTADEDTGDEPLPYITRDALLTAAERSFFAALQTACNGRSLIFAQVQLSKLIYPRAGIPRWQTFQNKIDRKSVDFVLFDPTSLKVQLLIELDDRSHERKGRQDRDEFVNRALAAAGLKLLRVRVAASYNPSSLESRLRQAINGAPELPTNAPTA